MKDLMIFIKLMFKKMNINDFPSMRYDIDGSSYSPNIGEKWLFPRWKIAKILAKQPYGKKTKQQSLLTIYRDLLFQDLETSYDPIHSYSINGWNFYPEKKYYFPRWEISKRMKKRGIKSKIVPREKISFFFIATFLSVAMIAATIIGSVCAIKFAKEQNSLLQTTTIDGKEYRLIPIKEKKETNDLFNEEDIINNTPIRKIKGNCKPVEIQDYFEGRTGKFSSGKIFIAENHSFVIGVTAFYTELVNQPVLITGKVGGWIWRSILLIPE